MARYIIDLIASNTVKKMNKENLYVGMRVRVKSDYNHVVNNMLIANYVGTVIDVDCKWPGNFDALVEFDNCINGHNGLGWGRVTGLNGHCYWAHACVLEQVIEPQVVPECLDIGYDELFM